MQGAHNENSATVDDHHSSRVLEWNSYRAAVGVRCAHLKMAPIRRNDAAPRARALCQQHGCVRASACRCDDAVPGCPAPHPAAARSATCEATLPCSCPSSTPPNSRNRSHVGPPSTRPADNNAPYQTSR